MINWAKYWTLYPKIICETDFLKQVGKTVWGENISYQQFRSIILGIEHHLDLKEADVVLDLCCGNGLITKEIAKLCKEVVGVDFLYTLLEVANKYHRPRKVSYKHISVLELDKLSTTFSGSFNRFLCMKPYNTLKNETW